MKINKKRLDEIECLLYFKPNIKYPEVTEEDIIMYFEWSEQGRHKDKIDTYKIDGFNCLIQCKRWRGIHVHQMYEQELSNMCTTPYYDLLKGMPEPVVKFLSKEMFKGLDEQRILEVYSIIKEDEKVQST